MSDEIEPGWLELDLTDEQVDALIDDGETATFDYEGYRITVGVEGMNGYPFDETYEQTPEDVTLKVHPYLAKQAVNTDHTPTYPFIDCGVRFTVDGEITDEPAVRTDGGRPMESDRMKTVTDGGEAIQDQPRQLVDTERLRLTDLLRSGRTVFVPAVWVIVWTATVFSVVDGLTNALIILGLLALYRTYTRRDAVGGSTDE